MAANDAPRPIQPTSGDVAVSIQLPESTSESFRAGSMSPRPNSGSGGASPSGAPHVESRPRCARTSCPGVVCDEETGPSEEAASVVFVDSRTQSVPRLKLNVDVHSPRHPRHSSCTGDAPGDDANHTPRSAHGGMPQRTATLGGSERHRRASWVDVSGSGGGTPVGSGDQLLADPNAMNSQLDSAMYAVGASARTESISSVVKTTDSTTALVQPRSFSTFAPRVAPDPELGLKPGKGSGAIAVGTPVPEGEADRLSLGNRQCVMLTLVVAVLISLGLAVGLGVGLGVGLRSGGNSGGVAAPSTPANTQPQPTYVVMAIGYVPARFANVTQLPSSLAPVVQPGSVSSPAQAASHARALDAALKQDPQRVVDGLFIVWSEQVGKNYTSLDESLGTLDAFNASLHRMVQTNLDLPTDTDYASWASLNQFSGLTEEEATGNLTIAFTRLTNRTAPTSNASTGGSEGDANSNMTRRRELATVATGTTKVTPAPPPAPAPLPKFVNWTTSGRLTPIKDQGACASCWAHAGTSALEAAIAIKYPYSTPTSFSRQVLVSCANTAWAPDAPFMSVGCTTGAVDDAFGYSAWFTLPVESTYPYKSGNTGKNGKCGPANMTLPRTADNWMMMNGSKQYDWLADQGAWGYDNVLYIQPGNETALMQAVVVQPVVFYWATAPLWYQYGGGVYLARKVECGVMVNHAMLLVGYDIAAGAWLIQNSWGQLWGEKGFGHVKMTHDAVGPCLMYQNLFAPKIDRLMIVPSNISNAKPLNATANSTACVDKVTTCAADAKKLCGTNAKCTVATLCASTASFAASCIKTCGKCPTTSTTPKTSGTTTKTTSSTTKVSTTTKT